MSVYEYKIVDGRKEHVEKEVNELAQMGWQVFGSIHVRTYNGETLFTQTMTKPTFVEGTMFGRIGTE